jgi:hypothetical protein
MTMARRPPATQRFAARRRHPPVGGKQYGSVASVRHAASDNQATLVARHRPPAAWRCTRRAMPFAATQRDGPSHNANLGAVNKPVDTRSELVAIPVAPTTDPEVRRARGNAFPLANSPTLRDDRFNDMKGVIMHASVGDRLVIVGHRVGQRPREGEILEVQGADGSPPYMVRWGDTGQEGLIFPGSDASVQHVDHQSR